MRSAVTIQLYPRPSDSEGEGTEVVWRWGSFEHVQRLRCGGNPLRRLRQEFARVYDQIHGGKASRRDCANARANLRWVLREAHRVGRVFFTGASGPAQMPPWLPILLHQAVEWQIEAPSPSMFPIDMLPLGWMSVSTAVFSRFLMEHDDLSTSELASILPCWQWPVVRRFLEMEQPSRAPLPRHEKVRLAFIGDGAPESLRDSLREGMGRAHATLVKHDRLAASYEIEHPWPDNEAQKTEDIVSSLARHLVNPEYMPRGSHHPNTPAAVTHFYCHGITSLDQSKTKRGMHFELHIGQLGKTDDHHKITTKELRHHMELQQADPSHSGKAQRTLIFMNACACGMQAPMDDVALASVFLSKRHPAVIALEARIDGGTARRISSHFYDCLLDSVPAHVALWQAQRQLTCETTTKQAPFPAALLYSCYGIPDCRLSRNTTEQLPLKSPLTDSGVFSDLFFPPA